MSCTNVNPVATERPAQRPIGTPIIRRQRVYGALDGEEQAEGRWLALQALADVMQGVFGSCTDPTIIEQLDGKYELPAERAPQSRSGAHNSSSLGIIQQFSTAERALPSFETGWPSDEDFRLELAAEQAVKRPKRKPIKRVPEPHTIPLPIESTAEPTEYAQRTTRVERARLLDGIRRFSHKRVRKCHKQPIGNDPVQLIHRDDGSCCIMGLETCSSVHACPVCANKICAGRAEEVTEAATLWRQKGYRTYLLTLTIRHTDGDDLQELLGGLSHSWSAMWEGRNGIDLKAQLQTKHYIRAFECTYADFPANGWHPHLHALLFCDTEHSEPERARLETAINDRWKRIILRKLGEKHVPGPDKEGIEHGTTFKISTDAGYIAKLGLEVASIVTKHAAGEHRSTWQIAEDAALGDKKSIALWRQWDRCSMGRKQLTWSRGAKTAFRIAERTDEQLCLFDDEQLAQGPCYVIALYEAKEWRRLAYQHRYWLARVTAALQSDNPTAAVERLPGERLPLERAGPGFVPAIGFTPKRELFKVAAHRPARHDTPDRLAEIRLRQTEHEASDAARIEALKSEQATRITKPQVWPTYVPPEPPAQRMLF
jgi:hypothetical protein